jgi:hypothetical protein
MIRGEIGSSPAKDAVPKNGLNTDVLLSRFGLEPARKKSKRRTFSVIGSVK